MEASAQRRRPMAMETSAQANVDYHPECHYVVSQSEVIFLILLKRKRGFNTLIL